MIAAETPRAPAAFAGTCRAAGLTFSTEIPDMDFETYSTAGYNWDDVKKKWTSVVAPREGGIVAVGAAAYSEHTSTEVLCLAYDLKDSQGPRIWIPPSPPPQELFDYLATGGVIEAWNTSFEFYIWTNVCVPRMGWPPLDFRQLRCAMSKARAHSLPGALGDAGAALNLAHQKDKGGKRLLNKFSKGRAPTKKDSRTRILPSEDPEGAQLYAYCMDDIEAESAVSRVVPDLSQDELDLWILDQSINYRGVAIDLEGLNNCIAIIEQATYKYTIELQRITEGAIKTANQVKEISAWLHGRGVHLESLDADAVIAALERDDIPPDCRRVLEIRQALASASVKKTFAIDRRMSVDGRLRDLFAFCGAQRTGRFAGRGPQPQNLPASGPAIYRCACTRFYPRFLPGDCCPWCRVPGTPRDENVEWGHEAVRDALEVIATRSLETVEYYFGDACGVVAACLRGLFVASEGHDLICSDYSAIEAVVLAMLAGEQWRIDVFNTHGKIYEATAAKIAGISFEEMVQYKKDTGQHHPARKKFGKYAELASGYQGWVGAWIAFGADKHLTEDQIKDAVTKWRADNPAIAGVRGEDGVVRGGIWNGLMDAAVLAVRTPSQSFAYRGIVYGMKDNVLYCTLPSGRNLTYHSPQVEWKENLYGKFVWHLTYMGWNSDPKKGPYGWICLESYGGKLTENVVQAIARDILVFAMKNLEAAGYWIVLHVHDEIVAEVLKGFGNIEEFERIMSIMPPWASDWPIKAKGGWRGRAYRKD